MIVGLLPEVGKPGNALSAAITRGIEALQHVDLIMAEAGHHDLEGDDLFKRQDYVP